LAAALDLAIQNNLATLLAQEAKRERAALKRKRGGFIAQYFRRCLSG